MKNVTLLTVVVLALIYTSCQNAQKGSTTNTDSIRKDSIQKSLPPNKTSDSSASVCFEPFNGITGGSPKDRSSNFQKREEGFDIYYAHADVQLSWANDDKLNNKNDLRIKFELPPAFNFGNWLSIRKDLQTVVNLVGYTGIMVRLKVEALKPGVFLRITIADIADIQSSDDELWWFDIDQSYLGKSRGKWTEIRIPFNKFYISWGDGSRQNNGIFDLDKIVAYEFNFVSEPKKHPSGTLLVESVCTYK
jgi:hypothetical protein